MFNTYSNGNTHMINVRGNIRCNKIRTVIQKRHECACMVHVAKHVITNYTLPTARLYEFVYVNITFLELTNCFYGAKRNRMKVAKKIFALVFCLNRI